MKPLRWIALLPAALAGAALAYLATLLLYGLVHALGAIESGAWVPAVGSLASGYVFVLVGARVAPSKRRAVASGLSLLFSVAAVVVAFRVNLDPSPYDFLCVALGVIGSVLSVLRVYDLFARPRDRGRDDSTALHITPGRSASGDL